MGSQRRYWNKFDDDDTYEISSWQNGLYIPGLYHGFDAVLGGDMSLTLNHDDTGYQRVKKDKTLENKSGLFITTQGTVVYDTNVYNLNISTTGATEKRVDLIVVTHEYIDVDDGEQATITVIEGTPVVGSAIPIAPSLTSPETQIIIGEIRLPENCTTLNQLGVIYTKKDSPNYANSPIPRLNKDNVYKGVNTEGVTINPDFVGGTYSRSIILFEGRNNVLITTNDNIESITVSNDVKQGCRLKIFFTEDVSIYDSNSFAKIENYRTSTYGIDLRGNVNKLASAPHNHDRLEFEDGESIELILIGDYFQYIDSNNKFIKNPLLNPLKWSNLINPQNIFSQEETVQAQMIGNIVHLRGQFTTIVPAGVRADLPDPEMYVNTNKNLSIDVGNNTVQIPVTLHIATDGSIRLLFDEALRLFSPSVGITLDGLYYYVR